MSRGLHRAVRCFFAGLPALVRATPPRRPGRPSRVAPWLGLAIVPAVAVGACYGATEVAIEITTDRACSDELKTAIYRGDYRRSKNPPSAVVDGCPGATAGAGAIAIGSVVLVPSGSRSDEVTVTVVMRVDGQDPDACLEEGAAKDACILATRTFRYIEHASLTLPILLSDACRGVECGEGETCGSGGACVDQRVSCDRGTCDPTPPAIDDAGLDAGDPTPVVDAAPDGSPPTVCGVSNGVVHNETEMPRLASASGKKFYYVSPSSNTLYSVSQDGALTKEFPRVPAAGTVPEEIEITALTSRGGAWSIGTREPGGGGDDKKKAFVHGPGMKSVPVDLSQVDSLAIAPDTQDAYAVSNQGEGVVRIQDDRSPEMWLKGSPNLPPVAADDTAVYVTDSAWIYALGRTDNPTLSPLNFGPGKNYPNALILASNDTSVFAAFPLESSISGPPSAWQIRKLALSSSSSPVLVPQTSGAVSALAADAVHVYWSTPPTDGINPNQQTIHRKAISDDTGGFNTEQTLVVDNADELKYLAVEDGCVYYWTSTSGGAQLRASPITGFQ